MRAVRLVLAAFIAAIAIGATAGLASAGEKPSDKHATAACKTDRHGQEDKHNGDSRDAHKSGKEKDKKSDKDHPGKDHKEKHEDCEKKESSEHEDEDKDNDEHETSKPSSGVQAVTASVPSTGGFDLNGVGVAGILVLGGAGFVMTALIARPPKRQS